MWERNQSSAFYILVLLCTYHELNLGLQVSATTPTETKFCLRQRTFLPQQEKSLTWHDWEQNHWMQREIWRKGAVSLAAQQLAVCFTFRTKLVGNSTVRKVLVGFMLLLLFSYE